MSILLAANRAGALPFARITPAHLLLFAFLANLPDVDMLASYALTGDVLSYHGGATHGIAFALGCAAILAMAGAKQGRLTVLAVFAAALLSHALIDSLTGPALGWHATRGMPLLWPLVDGRLSLPLTLFPGPRHDSWARLFTQHNLWVMGYELLVFTPVLAWLLIRSPRESRLGRK